MTFRAKAPLTAAIRICLVRRALVGQSGAGLFQSGDLARVGKTGVRSGEEAEGSRCRHSELWHLVVAKEDEGTTLHEI